MMTYDETIDYIYSIFWRGTKLGLSRTVELLDKLGNPHKKLKFVHVTGTNGKGSTCAMIESALRRAGYRTGLFTSPYILRFNDRIRVNGQEIPDDDLIKLTEYVRPYAESMENMPSEFEMITCLGMQYFYEQQCDIVVLEVGMGGELDSTNVIDVPECAVMTAMGMDHTRELGSTMAEIAHTKAGIIKAGGEVVSYGGVPEAEAEFEKACRERNARLHVVDQSAVKITYTGLDGCRFDFGEFKDLFVPLAGTYQPHNAATAVTVLKILQDKGWRVSDDDIRQGLADTKWEGRFEVLRRDPVFILDGGHNPHGITATAKSIIEQFKGEKPVILMGVMADKDVDGILDIIAPLGKKFFAIRPDYHRSMDAPVLAEKIRAHGAEAVACDTIEEGVRAAVREAGEKGAVVALGSLYMSGDVRNAVEKL